MNSQLEIDSNTPKTAESYDFKLAHKVRKNKKILILSQIAKSKKNLFKNLKADNFPVPSPRIACMESPQKPLSDLSTAIGSPIINSNSSNREEGVFKFGMINEIMDEISYTEMESPILKKTCENTELNTENIAPVIKSCINSFNFTFLEAEKEQFNAPKSKRQNIDGKNNELLLMKISEVEEGFKLHCTEEQNKHVSVIIDELIAINCQEKENLLRICTDSIVCSIALIACSKVGISKNIFLKVLSEKINRKTTINIPKIKGTLCYTLLKKKFVERV